jgi:hypothetical protein
MLLQKLDHGQVSTRDGFFEDDAMVFEHEAAPKLNDEGIGSVLGSVMGQLHGILG